MLALPLKSYGQFGLDSVTNFAVYAGSGVTLTVGGTPVTTITGDVGLGSSGIQNFSTEFNINGTYRVDPTATYNNSYSAKFGGTAVQNMGTVSTTVANVSATDAALPVTASYGAITTKTTISGNSGNSDTNFINVISVGSISMNGNSRILTLQGTADDFFIINVANFVAFTNAATIALSGVQTDHVLFNLLNTSGLLSSNVLSVVGAGTLFGTFIAPDGSMDIIGSGTIDGGVFAGGNNLTINSGTITADVFLLPEPSSFALVGISCLFGLGLWSRRRTRC